MCIEYSAMTLNALKVVAVEASKNLGEANLLLQPQSSCLSLLLLLEHCNFY